MLYVWLPGSAASFQSQVYLPFAALRCSGGQAFYCSRHTYKCSLPGDKRVLTHAHSTQAHLFLHICSPTHSITQMVESDTNIAYYNINEPCLRWCWFESGTNKLNHAFRILS
ncbi:hypothetical protein GOODEAATRI_000805 [Goodea atripinnis]|uniref:Uncharacterized protein n=1 Tax=Goodea atripinnis TaxID=208336 RepID=A0ABV0PJS4_9TELE